MSSPDFAPESSSVLGPQERSTVGFDLGNAPESGPPAMKPSASEASTRQIAVVRQKSKKVVGDPQPVHVDEINIGLKDGSLEDILVQQARARVRVSRLKGRQPSDVSVDKKGDERKLNLTLRMMLGVRVAVGRQATIELSQGMLDDDFTQMDKYTFPPAGESGTGRLATPSHKLNKTFRFRDYAPKVFKNLRGLFGIDEASYTLSVAGEYDYLELITNSKSGSFFFYSHDQKYIIKNMKRAEAKFFRRILPQYYEHHRTHPDSMLTRFCGMYSVKSGRSSKKIPFVVMTCIDGGARLKLHTKYDLKGSSINRTAKEGEKVLKDNNLRDADGVFRFGSQKDAIIKVLREDAEFLSSVGVMDYSVFMSVHDTSRPVHMRQLLKRGHTEFFTFADEALNGSEPHFKRLSFKQSSLETVEEAKARSEDGADLDGDPLETALSTRDAASTTGIRYRPDGGIESEGDGPKEIYWMGVIDVLQVYTKMKHLETWYKGIGRVKSELSCVDPELYCKRFVEFMEDRSR